jgi:hypothetical protein
MSEAGFAPQPRAVRPGSSAGLDAGARLTSLDRVLLLVPTIAALVFGLAPLLAAVPFAHLAGYAGNDTFFYWLAGAATLGYGVSLVVGIREGSWRGLRAVVIAEVVFNVVTLYACALELGAGTATPIVSLIVVASLAQLAIAVGLLIEHRSAPFGPADIRGGRPALAVMAIAIVAATVFGILGAFLPVATTHFFGYQGTEVFLYRVAGAATLGYAVMGLFNVRSRNWREVRLPVLMAIVFNGVSFFAALRAIFQGDPLLMPVIVGVATFAVTVPMFYGFAITRASDESDDAVRTRR